MRIIPGKWYPYTTTRKVTCASLLTSSLLFGLQSLIVTSPARALITSDCYVIGLTNSLNERSLNEVEKVIKSHNVSLNYVNFDNSANNPQSQNQATAVAVQARELASEADNWDDAIPALRDPHLIAQTTAIRNAKKNLATMLQAIVVTTFSPDPQHAGHTISVSHWRPRAEATKAVTKYVSNNDRLRQIIASSQENILRVCEPKQK